MAQITITYNPGFSYNGTNKEETIATFDNSNRSERVEISSVSVYMGSINGRCYWPGGSTSTGNGGPFQTYVLINGTKSEIITVNNVVNTYNTSNGGTLPYLDQTRSYTLTFNPAVSVPARSIATIKLKMPRSGGQSMAYNWRNGVTVTYTVIPNIAPSPTNVTISCTGFTSNSINWKVTTGSTATDCRVYLDNSLHTTKGMSGTSVFGTMSSVKSTTHTIRAECKNSNSNWVGSNTVVVDCTIPPIYNAKISPNSSTTGTLSFTSSYNVQYYLDNNYLGTVNRNTNPNKSVSLKNNSLSNYTLKIARTDNTAITNSTTISNVDSRVPRITVSYNIIGTTCTVTATADSTCNNWYYTLDGVRYNLPSGSRSSITFTIENMIVNHTYKLIVYATRTSSGLQGSSTPVYPEPKGCIRIFDGGNSKAASVYIWIPSRGWVAAIPYVWDDGEWKMGT